MHFSSLRLYKIGILFMEKTKNLIFNTVILSEKNIKRCYLQDANQIIKRHNMIVLMLVYANWPLVYIFNM